jgi:hypothetical protein
MRRDGLQQAVNLPPRVDPLWTRILTSLAENACRKEQSVTSPDLE